MRGPNPSGRSHGPCLVALCCFLVFMSASVYMHSGNVFASEQIVAFDISRTEMSLAFTGVYVVGAFFAPVLGYLLDRYGARNVMLLASIWFAMGFLALTHIDSFLPFAVVLALFVGTGQSALGQRAASQLLVHHFDRRRGMALGIMITGASVAGIVTPPIAVYLLESMGWRDAYELFALIYLIFVLPLIAIIVRAHPRSAATVPASILEAYGTIVVTKTFWRAVLLFGLIEGVYVALNGHLFLHYTELGVDSYRAAAILSATSGAALLCKPITGWFIDRAGTARAALVVTTACAAAMGALAISSTYVPLLVSGVLLGFAFGGIIPLQATTLSRHFDTKEFGRAYGSLRLCTLPIAGGCVVFVGWLYEKTDSYVPSFVAFAVVFLLASGMKLMTSAPPLSRAASAGKTAFQ